jgi:hypothetical protein
MTTRLILACLLLFGAACKREQEPSRRGFRSGGTPVERDAGVPRGGAPEDPRGLADVGRMDLGSASEVLPADLAGVRLGMSAEELRRARPAARFAGRGEVAIEEAPTGSAFARFSYHFREGRLESLFLTMRYVSELGDEFLAKARAKWGEPSRDPLDVAAQQRYARRGDRVVSWRSQGFLVRVEKVQRDPHVRIFVTTR